MNYRHGRLSRSSATPRQRRKRELDADHHSCRRRRPRASTISTSGSPAPQLERELKLQEYSVSNRGLRPNLVGTPEQISERIAAYEAAGLDLLLLQMSPQAEEMDRFAAQVIAPMRAKTPELA